MEIKIYNPELGLDGTIDELLDWAYRYDKDYTDEALDEIARLAAEQNHEKAEVPVLVKLDRSRTEGFPMSR